MTQLESQLQKIMNLPANTSLDYIKRIDITKLDQVTQQRIKHLLKQATR